MVNKQTCKTNANCDGLLLFLLLILYCAVIIIRGAKDVEGRRGLLCTKYKIFLFSPRKIAFGCFISCNLPEEGVSILVGCCCCELVDSRSISNQIIAKHSLQVQHTYTVG